MKKWVVYIHTHKLNEKDLIRAQKLITEFWLTIKETCKYYNVSAWYLYYYGIRKIKNKK
jgi:hypothetical protein